MNKPDLQDLPKLVGVFDDAVISVPYDAKVKRWWYEHHQCWIPESWLITSVKFEDILVKCQAILDNRFDIETSTAQFVTVRLPDGTGFAVNISRAVCYNVGYTVVPTEWSRLYFKDFSDWNGCPVYPVHGGLSQYDQDNDEGTFWKNLDRWKFLEFLAGPKGIPKMIADIKKLEDHI